jgi:hypothetical protein
VNNLLEHDIEQFQKETVLAIIQKLPHGAGIVNGREKVLFRLSGLFKKTLSVIPRGTIGQSRRAPEKQPPGAPSDADFRQSILTLRRSARRLRRK